MEDDADQNALDGESSPADLLQLTGGEGSPYLANQTSYDVADNGLLSSNAVQTTASNGAVTGTSGGSTSATPGWLNSILSLSGAANTVAGQVAPLINGKSATGPAAPGAQPVNGVVKPPMSIGSYLPLIIIGVVLFFLFGRKSRA